MPEGVHTAPLVVFGFDAGDPHLLTQWAEDGTLPTLQSLMTRGCWGRTIGPELISEHGIWATLVSGVSRADHGYYYHRQLVPRSYALAPSRGHHVAATPFWHRLPPEVRIAIVDIPDIAEPVPQTGIQISEWATHYPYFEPSTHPPELLPAVRAMFGPQMIVHEDLDSSARDDQRIYERLRTRIRKKGDVCRQLLDRNEHDLIFVVFGESHTGGHQFWKYHRQGSGARDSRSKTLSSAIREIYRAIDQEMGRILQRVAGPANTFVISSVGMKSQFPAAGLGESFCRGLGYQAAPPAEEEGRGSIAFLRRVLPVSIRNQLSRLLSRDTQERLLSEKYVTGTDWRRTTLFSIPSYYTTLLRVNLKGREPQGIVESGGPYDDLLKRAQSDAERLLDPVTGARAVRDVVRTVDLFGPKPPAVLPDMFIEWAEADHFMERVVHPKVELLQDRCEFHRSSDHSREGFVAAAGPSIVDGGDLGDIDPLDLAPTFLTLLGRQGHDDLAGKPLAIRPADDRGAWKVGG